MNCKVSPEDAKILAFLYKDGREYEELTELFNISKTTLLRHLERQGVSLRDKKPKAKTIPNQHEEVILRYKRGDTTNNIVKELRISNRSVYKELRKASLISLIPDRHKPNLRTPGREVVINTKFGMIRKSANHRGLVFDLTKEEVASLIFSNCNYCGINPNTSFPIRIKTLKETYLINGIDRRDSKEGYTISNCVPCCKQCNYAKLDYTTKEFLTWLERTYHHSINNLYQG